ncbi:MAG: NYN domain-containing protein [Deltaproteobacteria bacterium]|nr:NYN domain-containing protein [Deltaproteobacteria bacterium]
MHIIVDGYNLIRQSDALRGQERLSLEAGRRALVLSLARYRKRKGHRITVVFDGWKGGSPQEERDLAGGVQIIYSRLGEKADEVIKRLVEAAGGEETLVVTSDREIAVFADRRGKTAIDSPAFTTRLERLAAEPAPAVGSNPEEEEDDDRSSAAKKKGPAHRLSKQKRAALARFKKL